MYINYGHLVYILAIWYILSPFGIFIPVAPRKIWQPGPVPQSVSADILSEKQGDSTEREQTKHKKIDSIWSH
jgi:hypothetical protein